MDQLAINRAMEAAGSHYAAARFAEAAEAYRAAARLAPDFALAHVGLATSLLNLGRYSQAAASFEGALRIQPDFPAALCNYGAALIKLGRLDDAIAALNHAVDLSPDLAEAHMSRANALKEQGRLDEALAAADRAIALRPGSAAMAASRLYLLHFSEASTSASLAAEHRKWNARFGEPFKAQIKPFANSLDLHRKPRVGLVSPDFRLHPVGRFLLPLFRHRDRSAYELYCYSDVGCRDDLTRRFEAGADVWRETAHFTDAQLVEQIRTDGIDVLVDLTMHMSGSRLGVFAQKPAPVAVSYLAYASTTGLTTIDYRLSDNHLDPPGQDIAGIYSEHTIRLPGCYWCYENIDVSEPTPLPALANGYITFGCLNNFGKISPGALRVWAEILKQTPRSRLILHASEGSCRSRTLDAFAALGIDRARIDFVGIEPLLKYLHVYDAIDIMLDPFPYAGGTTTCDGLWMGVPIVTLAGKTAVGRAGVSILKTIGLPDWIAADETEYIQLATRRAADLPALSSLRQTLRPRMAASPLMDSRRFAADMQTAFVWMCRKWQDAMRGR